MRCVMVMDINYGLIVQNMRVIGNLIKLMGLANYYMQMVMCMKVIG